MRHRKNRKPRKRVLAIAAAVVTAAAGAWQTLRRIRRH